MSNEEQSAYTVYTRAYILEDIPVEAESKRCVSCVFCSVLEPEAVEPAVSAWILLRHLF